MGKPFGKSTKGKAKASSESANSQLKLRTKWWMNTAISSFASSDPAQSRGPPPNGMKWLPAEGPAPLDDDRRPLFCHNTQMIVHYCTIKDKPYIQFFYETHQANKCIFFFKIVRWKLKIKNRKSKRK